MTAGLAVAVAALTILTGCGGTDVAVSPTATSDQDKVLFSLLLEHPEFKAASVPREQMIRAAHRVCDGFDTDGKVATFELLAETGFTLDQALNFAYAAAVAYCPERLAEVGNG
jgi:hypothetical protein